MGCPLLPETQDSLTGEPPFINDVMARGVCCRGVGKGERSPQWMAVPPSCGASRHLHGLHLGNGDRHDTQASNFESHHVDSAWFAGAASVAVAGIGGFLRGRTGPDLPPLDRVQVAYAERQACDLWSR